MLTHLKIFLLFSSLHGYAMYDGAQAPTADIRYFALDQAGKVVPLSVGAEQVVPYEGVISGATVVIDPNDTADTILAKAKLVARGHYPRIFNAQGRVLPALDPSAVEFVVLP